jgi:hypothetical protein
MEHLDDRNPLVTHSPQCEGRDSVQFMTVNTIITVVCRVLVEIKENVTRTHNLIYMFIVLLHERTRTTDNSLGYQ